MKVNGYYGFADIRNIEFANGIQNSATIGIFGGGGGCCCEPGSVGQQALSE